MVRSRWIKAVLATLAAGGMAWGQSAAPSPPKAPDDPTGRIVTIAEAGKPGQKCRVVKWWVDEKGNKVWQVQAIDTGETMTIIAGGAPVVGEAGQPHSLKTTIFHWRDHTPPPGAPLPPGVACECGTPCPTCTDTGKVVQAEPSVFQKWRESWGNKAEAPKKVVAEVDQLPKAEPKKADPLLGDPTQFAKKPLDEKLPPKKDLPPAGPPRAGQPLEYGGKSVIDSGAVAYRPVPVMTLPPYNPVPPSRPPSPQWQVPQAPNPIVNPGRGNAPEAHQGGIYYNAFTPTEYTPPAPGTPAQGAMANAFSADTDCCVAPVPHGPPAGGVYGPPPGPPRNLMLAQASPRPTGPLPAAPYGPVVQLPPANGAGQGTQPPAQGSGVMPASYQAPAAAQTPQQLTATLHDALYPSQREMAAEKLSGYDGKQNELAVQALTRGIKDDPAPTVRASCIRALAKMKANVSPVVSAIQAAKNDSDGRVRTEAEQALSVLAPKGTHPAPVPPAALPQAVQPVSAVSPAPTPPAGSNSPLPALPPVK